MSHILNFEDFLNEASQLTNSIKEENQNVLYEGVGDTIKIVKPKSKSVKGDFSNFVGDEGKVIEYPYSSKFVSVLMDTGIMKGSTMLFPTDIIQTNN